MEAQVKIRMADVVRVEKKNIAFVIPNSLSIVMTTNEEHTFASFIARDEVYDLLLPLIPKHDPHPEADTVPEASGTSSVRSKASPSADADAASAPVEAHSSSVGASASAEPSSPRESESVLRKSISVVGDVLSYLNPISYMENSPSKPHSRSDSTIPLHHATRIHNTDIISFLLSHGADVNLAGNCKSKPN